MLFEVLYTFVLDDEVKRPGMHVDIDDYDAGLRLLKIGAAVKVPEALARPDTSARKLDHDHSADILPTAEMNAAETTEPAVQAMELADRTLAHLADAQARGDRAEAALAGERRRADALRDRLDALTAELREAQEAVEARADGAARKAMSRWRRAWDGWRGR